MRRTQIGVGAVSLLAVGLAALHLGSGRQAPPDQSASGSRIKTDIRQPRKTAKKLASEEGSCSAYRDPAEQKTPAAGQEKDPNWGTAWKVINKFRQSGDSTSTPISLTQMHFVVATVPDPRHTRLSMKFDRDIESIEEAAQDEGYVYNSFWMPWRVDDTRYQLRSDEENEEASTEEKENCPGILLFRKDYAATESFSDGLLVLIVGEQPTGGINVYQWNNAIDWLKNSGVKLTTLRVLGPSFSGSLPSLENRLRSVSPSGKTFGWSYVFSGAVTECDAIEHFRDHLAKSPVSFQLFQENDEVNIHRYLAFLKYQGIKLDTVAILSEDETAYGNSSHDDQASGTHASINKVSGRCEFSTAEKDGPVKLFFPRDISALRTAYQEQSIFSRLSGPSSGEVATPRFVLREDIGGEEVGDGDTPVEYAQQKTSLTEEAELYGIVSYLKAHHTKSLVIRATNPLDSLFLTRFMHHAYPEARVVTMGADLLFTREVDSTEFRGTMALSNYPLLPRLQHWTEFSDKTSALAHAHRAHPSTEVEGIYQAARFLFDQQHETPDITNPPSSIPGSDGSAAALAFKERIYDFADPYWLSKTCGNIKGYRPATWLTVAGRDGYWPVAVLSDGTTPTEPTGGEGSKQLDNKTSLNTNSTSNSPLPTEAFEQPGAKYKDLDDNYARDGILQVPSTIWLLSLILVIICILYLAIGCLGGKQVWNLRFYQAFRPRCDWRQPFFWGLCSACSFCLLLVLCAPFLMQRETYFMSTTVILWKMLGIVLSAVTIAALYSAVKLKEASDRSRPWSFLAGMFLVSYGYMVLVLPREPSPSVQTTFPYRAAHLANGVSPLPPLLFLLFGILVWAWLNLEGSVLLMDGKPLLPTVPREASKGRSKYYRISADMAMRIESIAKPLCVVGSERQLLVWVLPALAVGVIVLSAALQSGSPVESMETHRYTGILQFLLVFAIVSVLMGCSRLYWTWRELRRLLSSLAQTPLRRTFAALQGIEVRSLWGMSGDVPRTQFIFFRYQLEAAKQLANIFDSLPDEVRNDVQLRSWRACLETLVQAGETFEGRYQCAVASTAWWDQPVEVNQEKIKLRETIQCFASGTLELLHSPWEKEVRETVSSPVPRGTTDPDEDLRGHSAEPLSEDPWVCASEQVICLLYVSFIQNVMARMRTMVLAMSAAYVSMMLAIAFYPFTPRPAIATWMMILLIVMGAVVAAVYAGLERDRVLSDITNTSPILSAEFWLKYATFLIPPFLALLTAQFPEIAESVLSWVQPTLEAVK